MKLPALLVLGVLALAPTAKAADLSGLWIISSSIVQSPVTMDCSILQVGVGLSGWCESENSDATPAALTGSINQNTASWAYTLTVQGQPMRVAYQTTVTGDAKAMSGQLTYGVSSATLSAVRK